MLYKKINAPFLTLFFILIIFISPFDIIFGIFLDTSSILQAQSQKNVDKTSQSDTDTEDKTTQANKNYISSDVINSLLESSVMIVSEKINYTNPLQPKNDFLFFSNDSNNPFDNFRQDSTEGAKKQLGLHLSKALGSGAIFKKIENTTADSQKETEKKFTYNIVTNAHVVNTFTTLWVVLSDDSFFPAQLIGMETQYDIAVLKFSSDRDLPVTSFGDSELITEGDLVFAIGNPFGISFTVTQGIVSQAKRYTEYTFDKKSSINFGGPFIQIDAAINKGNSGGILANSVGKVIGINTFIISSIGAQNIGLNFAIPINYVVQSIDRIFSNTPFVPSWIGVLTYDLPLRARHTLGITNRSGVFINNVVLSSEAYKVGLRNGDFIVSIDSKKIISRDGFSSVFEEIAKKTPGTSVNIEVQRLIFEKNNTNLETKKSNFTYTRFDFSVPLEKRPNLDSAKIQKLTQNLLWPGMIIKPLENYEKELFGLSDKEEGVIVTHVFKETPAFNAGFKKHDIIIVADDTLLLSFVHYLHIMRNTNTQLKTDIKFTVLRSAQLVDITLKKPRF